ncbi:MAG: hypothetical protein J6Q22_00160, partial [Prevotella sp.]|nr:hypothetical protein [Prevotella sp.]
FGGAPVVVIQKIDELPQWAAPSPNGTYGINDNNASEFPWNPIYTPQGQLLGQQGIANPDTPGDDSTTMEKCSDCYYISTLTPQQYQTLEQDGASAWDSYDKDNGLLPGTPPLSQQTMNIPNTAGTGLNSTNVPVEGPPVFNSPNLGYQNTGGGATYLNGSTESAYVQQVMEDLSSGKLNGLPQGYYYFQGNIGVPSSSNPQNNSTNSNADGTFGNVDGNAGQVYNDYPNQTKYDNQINGVTGSAATSSTQDYPYINPNNPGVYGYPEPTPLPTQCTSAGCTLNIGSTWYQAPYSWPEGGNTPNGGPTVTQGIGVVDTINYNYPSSPYANDISEMAGSSHTMEMERYHTTLMRAAAFLATPSRPASSVSSMPHSTSDFRDAFFVTPRSGSRVSVPHASLMSYGFPMRSVSYHGRDQSYGGFANVLYDFDLERLFGLKSIVTPFIGGGAGYLWQRYDDMGPVAAASITGVHGGFAWQGIAGVAFDTGIAGLQVVAQYRMIGQPGSFYNGSFNYGTEGGHANFDQRFNHQFIVGFRYAFHNQPVHITPPSPSLPAALAAAAAPAPVPARSYLVFFDWNQYAL